MSTRGHTKSHNLLNLWARGSRGNTTMHDLHGRVPHEFFPPSIGSLPLHNINMYNISVLPSHINITRLLACVLDSEKLTCDMPYIISTLSYKVSVIRTKMRLMKLWYCSRDLFPFSTSSLNLDLRINRGEKWKHFRKLTLQVQFIRMDHL